MANDLIVNSSFMNGQVSLQLELEVPLTGGNWIRFGCSNCS